MKLTEQQEKVIGGLKNAKDGDIFVVTAYSGTGKTSTLVEAMKQIKPKSAMYLAFNKSIANEAKTKFPKPVVVKTTHSLAFGKAKQIIGDFTLGFHNAFSISELLGVSDYSLAQNVVKHFDSWCNSSIDLDKYIERKDLAGEIGDCMFDLEHKMRNLETEITHSYYLKVFEIALRKKQTYVAKMDYLLLDEAQDTNPVTLSIFYNLPARVKIVVGDPYQQIYTFRGSVNALDKIRKAGKDKVTNLYLTNSFRFPQEVADKANAVIQGLLGAKIPLAGKGAKVKEHKTACIIARTNAQLLEEVINLIDDGIYSIKSVRDVENIVKAPLVAMFYYLGNFNAIQLLKAYGISYYQEDKFYKKLKEEFPSMSDAKKFLEENDDKEALSVLKLITITKDKILDAAKLLLENKTIANENVDYFITTGHTAKGLEWDKVKVCEDFNFNSIFRDFIRDEMKNTLGRKPNQSEVDDAITTELKYWAYEFLVAVKFDTLPFKLREELNLFYVAVTRAKSDISLKVEDKVWDDFLKNQDIVKALAGVYENETMLEPDTDLHDELYKIKQLVDNLEKHPSETEKKEDEKG